MYDNYSQLRDELEKVSGDGTVLVLSPEASGSGPRKKLFAVTGPQGKLNSSKSSLESYAGNSESLKFFVGATSEPVGERIYLEGIIYYQDKDCALIISLDQLGKKSNRILYCIDTKSKKEKWIVNQDDMFKKMAINEDKDSFSSLFFTKDNIKVMRSGNLVLLKLKGEGIMAFDYGTGKKLWTLDL
jgi:outer membrane protein assembly factor BamB